MLYNISKQLILYTAVCTSYSHTPYLVPPSFPLPTGKH